MIILPFRVEDLTRIKAQEDGQHASVEQAVLLEGLRSFTCWHEDEPVLCGGAVEMWSGRFVVWALLSKNAGRCALKLQRAVKQFLDGLEARRIEAYVRCDKFEIGHRWVVSLGFEVEKERMPKFLPDGADATMYVKVN